MTTSSPTLYDYSNMAAAAYVEFVIANNALSGVALVDQLVAAGWEAAQATAFADEWEVLDQYTNEALLVGTGFSGALFRNRHNPEMTVFGVRGSEDFILDFFVADGVQMVGEGLAYNQIIDMYNYWKRLEAQDGSDVMQVRLREVGPNDPLFNDPTKTITVREHDGDAWQNIKYTIETYLAEGVGLGFGYQTSYLDGVTGHSLGGHLASGFARIFGAEAININGAGYPTDFFPGLSGNALSNISNLFGMLGGAASFEGLSILNLYGDKNPNIVTQNWALVQPGEHAALYIENAGVQHAIGHSSAGMAEALSVYDLFIRLDSSLEANSQLALELLRSIFHNATNDDNYIEIVDFPNNTLERIINQLSRIFGVPSALNNSEGDNSQWAQINRLTSQDSGSKFSANLGSFRVVDMTSMDLSTLVQMAQSDKGYLYALLNQCMFALAENDAFYAGSEFSYYLDASKYSPVYLADLARTLLITSSFNDGELDANDTVPYSGDRYYWDNWDSNEVGDWDYYTFVDGHRINFTVDGVDELLETRNHIIYTDSNSANIIEGGELSDRIYGAGGDDEIRADDGDDRIEGGDGADRLYGEDGNDVIYGNDGVDTITGGAGSDRLYGGGGKDALNGGAGNDRLEGGEGLDQYVVGEGVDTLFDSDGDGRIVWSSVDDFVVRGRDGVGNPANDWIKISDTQYFDRQNTVTYTRLIQTDGSTTLSIVSPTRTTGTARLRIENFHDGDLGITLGEAVAAPIAQTITDGPDVYGVNSVTLGLAHVVNGLGGNDLISGGVANDYLVGGDGNDLLIGNVGADTYIGGDGDDFIMDNGYDSANATPMPLTPALEAQTVVVLGQDWYITQQGDGYKFAYDSLPDNVSYGSPEAESDVVLAGQGNDHVWLGVGNDFADGDEGDDYMSRQAA